ncbi:MAG: HlyD family efflux transporter periplasmic adaptor subunit [Coriobacteriia bacterium]|nr:HlyD family efflux transporter periplasmic adaptor subunit [Coriobacteriia bacterium]
MNRSGRIVAILAIIAVVVAGGVSWARASKAAPTNRLVVAGNARADIRTISAPALTYTVPDYTVGIPKPAGSNPAAMGTGSKRSAPSTAARSSQPVVSGRLTKVLVREGDHVDAGQVVAEFDTALLDLGVDAAEAAARKSRTDVSVIDGNLDDLDTASGKLADARTKMATAKASLLKARSTLTKARATLLSQRAKLRAAKAQRPQLEAALAALKAQAATFPPGSVPPALQAKIADLTKLLASIDPGLAAIAKGLAKVDTNLAKVEKGLASLPAASAKLSSAEAKLDDARTMLGNAKDVLGIVADGQSIGVQLAKARLAQATVRAPYAGTVTFARRSNTVAMVGAPLVRVAADGVQRVDTYLTADQVARVTIGSEADVTYDSAPGTTLHGAVATISSAYVFPPTSFPTQIVHMTRAVKVTIELDEGDTAPPGTPVDVSIHTD